MDDDKLKVINSVSYGFRKGFGVQKAVTVARNIRRDHPWVLKSDIQSFFDKIQRETLKNDISRRLGKSSVVPLVCCAIDTEIHCTNSSEKSRIEKAGIQPGLGLRQGMPLSPLLSNVVLREFDATLHKRKVRMVRYADDFAIFADSEPECRSILPLVKNLLAAKQHNVPEPGPESKTVIYRPDSAVEFLGFELRPSKQGKYVVAIPAAAFNELKKRLDQFRDFNEARNKWRYFSQTVSTLNSTVNGFVNVYEAGNNFGDFRAHAVNCRNQALNDLLGSIFGVEVLSKLDKSRRDFLDLIGDSYD